MSEEISPRTLLRLKRMFLVLAVFSAGLVIFALFVFVTQDIGVSGDLNLGVAFFLLVPNTLSYFYYRREYRKRIETEESKVRPQREPDKV